jgi:hypothetical protein
MHDASPKPATTAFRDGCPRVRRPFGKLPTPFRRALAWLYDFSAALFVVAFVLWEELVLNRLLKCPGQAWSDFQTSWSVELERYAEQNGLAAWRAGLLSSLPMGLENAILLLAAVLLVLLLRRFLRVTPGEWTFSSRRSPAPLPPPGFGRSLLRAAAGLAAFAAILLLWTVLVQLPAI